MHYVQCTGCDAIGPNDNLQNREEVIADWNRVASAPSRLTTATALLREIANGPVPAHGSLDVYARIAEFLRETDNDR